jgi:putative ABC transport system permease protein
MRGGSPRRWRARIVHVSIPKFGNVKNGIDAERSLKMQLEIAIARELGLPDPVGPIFMLGSAIGSIVGMMISHQFLYTDVPDQLPQYATLKAIGYENSYLVCAVLQQASFYAHFGFLPACVLGVCLSYVLADITLLPLHMSLGVVVATLGLGVFAGVLAVRRVLAADPADVF